MQGGRKRKNYRVVEFSLGHDAVLFISSYSSPRRRGIGGSTSRCVLSCVKGRDMCDIEIDRHGGFRNDDGKVPLSPYLFASESRQELLETHVQLTADLV